MISRRFPVKSKNSAGLCGLNLYWLEITRIASVSLDFFRGGCRGQIGAKGVGNLAIKNCSDFDARESTDANMPLTRSVLPAAAMIVTISGKAFDDFAYYLP